MPGMISQIGQQHHRATTVFSFFEPDFSPAGPVAKASLFAPEAEILTAPFIIGYMNAMSALVDNGLSGCGGGFGYDIPRANPHLAMPRSCSGEAAKMTADGVLTYEYQNRAGDVVSELALLLTGGREPPVVRALWDESQVQYVNVALNKPTTSSSAQLADAVVDGITNSGLFLSPQCSGEQWVQVDLGEVIDVANVKVYHRMDCCGDQINGATVLVSDTPDFTTSGVQCAAPLVFTGDPVESLRCPGTSGRYVTVRQDGTCLQMVELEVNAVRTGTIGEPVCAYVPPRDVCNELRCAAVGVCAEASTCAQPTETHEVVCCASHAIGGFRQNTPSTCPDVWGYTGGRNCQHALNSADAAAWCTTFGARLCTADELERDCGRATGCGHGEYITLFRFCVIWIGFVF